jgi:hypothetical protein
MQESHEYFGIGLPKWPALIVVGKSVTPEQAKEILIRTDDLSFSTNDHEFAKQLIEYTYKVRKSKNLYHTHLWDYFADNWKRSDRREKLIKGKVHSLSLEYLHNSRITTCYVGGPHGWCDWDGHIGTNTYNIGKYPSVECVYEEWATIADAFPYLDLQCQLLNQEICGEPEQARPIIQYDVRNGTVDMCHPTELLQPPHDTIDEDFSRIQNNVFGERGCTFEQYVEAYDFVIKKLKGF